MKIRYWLAAGSLFLGAFCDGHVAHATDGGWDRGDQITENPGCGITAHAHAPKPGTLFECRLVKIVMNNTGWTYQWPNKIPVKFCGVIGPSGGNPGRVGLSVNHKTGRVFVDTEGSIYATVAARWLINGDYDCFTDGFRDLPDNGNKYYEPWTSPPTWIPVDPNHPDQ